MQLIRLILFVVLSLSLNNVRATPITLDFEDLLGTGSNFTSFESYGNIITKSGFQLTTTAGLGGFLSYLPTFPLYTDSIELIANEANATNVLTQTDLSSFGIDSISLGFSDLFQPGTASLTFFGEKTNGNIVQQTFVISNAVSNFNFLSTFNNLVSLTWTQTQADANNHRFDNINVDDEAINLPEPSTLAIFVLSILGVMLRRSQGLYSSKKYH